MIQIFQMNDCDWWAGEDAESVKQAFAAEAGYTSVAECETDGLMDEMRPLTDSEVDALQFCYDTPEGRKVSFRTRLQEMITNKEPMPCFFASTEY